METKEELMQRRIRMTVASFLIELMTTVTILSCLFMAFAAYAQENPSSAPKNLLATREGQAKIRTLFLAANPLGTDRLQLDEEIRAIDAKIRSSGIPRRNGTCISMGCTA
jgi:hypothetical protein